MLAIVEQVRGLREVEDGKLVVAGYCFGGKCALDVARTGVDIVAALLGAKRVGASRLALLGAAIGTVAGLFLGLAGIIIGPFVGALLGEWLHGRRLGMAARVGVGTWLGIVFAAVLKLTLGFAMLGIFLFAWWW